MKKGIEIVPSVTTLRTVDGRHPVVRTGNEETNPMLELNRRLGFRAAGAWLQFEKP